MAIPVDEKFYFQFFRNKFLQIGAKSKKRKRKDGDSSDEDIQDDGAEADAGFDSMDEDDVHDAIMSTVPDGDAIESDDAEGCELDDEEFERMMKEGADNSDADSAEADGDEDEMLQVEDSDEEPDFEGDLLDTESLDDVEFSENDSDDDDLSGEEGFNYLDNECWA